MTGHRTDQDLEGSPGPPFAGKMDPRSSLSSQEIEPSRGRLNKNMGRWKGSSKNLNTILQGQGAQTRDLQAFAVSDLPVLVPLVPVSSSFKDCFQKGSPAPAGQPRLGQREPGAWSLEPGQGGTCNHKEEGKRRMPQHLCIPLAILGTPHMCFCRACPADHTVLGICSARQRSLVTVPFPSHQSH